MSDPTRTDLRTAAVSAALLATGFFVLYRNVIAKLVSDWAHDDNYSHGFLIVPIAAYLAWERRRDFAASPSRPSAAGLAVVAAGLAALIVGVLGSELFLTRISIVATLAGTILFLFGWKRLGVLAFPLAFLLLMIPLPAIIFNRIALPLQLLASRAGEATLSALAIPVLREGNVLVLANTSLEVAEACSGIRSLISLLTLAIVFGYLADRRAWVRGLIVLSTLPVAIIANAARVAGSGIAAHRYGAEAAEGFLHEFSGLVVFAVAFGMMLGLEQLVVRLAPPPSAERVDGAAAGS